MQFSTLPNAGSGYSDDGQWIFYQDEQAMEEISQAMKDDTLEEHLQRLSGPLWARIRAPADMARART